MSLNWMLGISENLQIVSQMVELVLQWVKQSMKQEKENLRHNLVFSVLPSAPSLFRVIKGPMYSGSPLGFIQTQLTTEVQKERDGCQGDSTTC